MSLGGAGLKIALGLGTVLGGVAAINEMKATNEKDSVIPERQKTLSDLLEENLFFADTFQGSDMMQWFHLHVMKDVTMFLTYPGPQILQNLPNDERLSPDASHYLVQYIESVATGEILCFRLICFNRLDPKLEILLKNNHGKIIIKE